MRAGQAWRDWEQDNSAHLHTRTDNCSKLVLPFLAARRILCDHLLCSDAGAAHHGPVGSLGDPALHHGGALAGVPLRPLRPNGGLRVLPGPLLLLQHHLPLPHPVLVVLGETGQHCSAVKVVTWAEPVEDYGDGQGEDEDP